MEDNKTTLGLNQKIVNVFHKLMLIVILHSSFVAPSQNLIIDYLNNPEPHVYIGSIYNNDDSQKVSTEKKNYSSKFLDNKKASTIINYKKSSVINSLSNFQIESDIELGIIGASNQNPLDDVTDNLFKFNIKELPNKDVKVFLKYELFGVQDLNAVTRSINDRPATGGYLVKIQNNWTTQKEELNIDWLKSGENKIIFTTPRNANYQYQIRNVKLEFELDSNINSSIVVNSSSLNYAKDNKIYIKGFLRNYSSDVKVLVEQSGLNFLNGEFEGFVNLTDEIKQRNFIIINAFDSKGHLGQQIISLDNILDADKVFEIEKILESKTFKVRTRTIEKLEVDGARLLINDSVLIQDKEISISKLRSVDIAPMASGMINVTKGGAAYRFLPDGTKFENPVQIELEYDEKLIPRGHSINDIKTFYFNTNLKKWIAIDRDTIDVKKMSILSFTDHFTDYVNGIIQTPESPETAGFTPTMMSDIKAVDPSSEMTLISPPDVSQKGDANVSYPIKIPSGRNGLQPQLSLQYNSEGGNGWLGQGWSINAPAIMIDTKWGVPKINNDFETEIYSLSGEQLMYPKIVNTQSQHVDWMPNRHYDEGNDGSGNPIYNTAQRAKINESEAFFTFRKQNSFSKVQRLGNLPNEYRWKVTNTDGTINWFGGDENGIIENSIIRNSENNIVHWGIYKTQDIHGNNIIYKYENQIVNTFSGVNSNLNSGRVFIIQDIFYTGYTNTLGKYNVKFITDKINLRPNQEIDARLGIKRIDPYLLKKIQILNDNIKFREYEFTYSIGRFGKSLLTKATEFDGKGKEFYHHDFEYYDDIIDENGNESYFSNGIEETICNDFTPPISSCYTIYGLPSSLFITPMNVYINNQLVPGGPFNNDIDFANAIAVSFPSLYCGFYLGELNYLGAFQSTMAFNTVSFVDLSGNPMNYNFNSDPAGCNTKLSSSKKEKNIFNDSNFPLLNSNYTINYSGSFQNGDPNCPDFINDDFLINGNIPSFNSTGAVLGSSTSNNYNIGGHLGFGVDFSWDPTTKNITIGGAYNHSWDESQSLTSLIDINGDGLDDLVFKAIDGKMYWKKHLLTRTTNTSGQEIINHSFGVYAPITSVNSYVNDFYKSYGQSSSWNLQANFGFSGGSGFAGWDTSKNKSKTKVYFTDVNADGLIDIVKNGTTFFNRIDTSGNPYFEPESKLTENMLIQASPVSVTIPNPDIEIDVPSYDVVKVWEAPIDGEITIYNNITNNDPSKEAIVTIEIEKDKTVYCGDSVNSGGGAGYQVFTVDFGTGVGNAGINYNAQSVPDKFDIIWNGQTFSSGYRGSNTYNNALLNAGVPLSEIQTASPSNGVGQLIFNKSSAYPTTAQIIVTAPLGGTAWSFSSFCVGSGRSFQPDSNLYESKNNFYTEIDLERIENKDFSVEIDGVNLKNDKFYNKTSINDFVTDFKEIFPFSEVKLTENTINIEMIKSYMKFDFIKFKQSDDSIVFKFVQDNNEENEVNKSVSENRFNNSTCSYEPAEMCMLFGVKLNSATPNVNNTITNFSTACSSQAGILKVKKGDRIYFRTHSIDNGNPAVYWDPRIEYNDNLINSIVDQNGIKPFNSSYSESFILSQKVPIVFPGNGSASITWDPFNVSNPTDELRYQIVRRDQNGSGYTDNIIFSQVCSPNVVTSLQPVGLSNIVVSGNNNNSNTQFFFKVFSTSNVKWANYLWKPKIILNTTQPIVGNSSNEGNVTVAETRFPIVDYSVYKNFTCANGGYNRLNVSSLNNGTTSLIISPNLLNVSFNSTDNGTVYFVVKKNNQYVGRRVIQVTNGNAVLQPGLISLGTNSGIIEVGFYTDDSQRSLNNPSDVSLLNRLLNVSNLIKITRSTSSFYYSSDTANLLQRPFGNFGPMYRQWGQFLYNPEVVNNAIHISSLNVNLIKEESLNITDAQATALQNSLLNSSNQINSNLQLLQNININDPSSASTIQNTLQTIQNNSGMNNIPFLIANAYKESEYGDEKWIGLHKENYASRWHTRAAKLNQSVDFQEDNTIYSGTFFTGAYGIDKYTVGNGSSVSAGGGFGGFGASGTTSLGGVSKSLSDFIDLNGDRYPDIITENQIQYTVRTGGLMSPMGRGSNNGEMSIDENGNWGFSASGTFGKSGKPNAGSEGAKPTPNGKLKIGKPGTSSFGGGNNSVGISGSFGQGNTFTSRLWADFNGDGLPDILAKDASNNVYVVLNYGNNNYDLSNNWGSFSLSQSKSTTFGGGLGFNYANASIEAGLSLGRTDSDTETTLIDLNGDGLLDKLTSNSSSIATDISLGNKFDSSISTMSHNFSYHNSATTTTSGLNITGTYSVIWPLYLIWVVIPLKIPDVSVTASTSNSTNRTKKTITDFDRDGYPDLLEEISSTRIRVHHSRIKRTNKLKSVINPLNGKFTIDYKVQMVDYDNPNPKWAMTQVIIEDGYDKVNDGFDVYKKNFIYEKGRYDRREREFYGYKTVKAEDYIFDSSGNEVIYRTNISNFNNLSYFLNGLTEDSYIVKGNDLNQKFSKTINYYEVYGLNNSNDEINLTTPLSSNYDIGGSEGRRSASVLLKKRVTELYELNATPQIISEVLMKYDSKGRIIEYFNKGNITDTSDDFTSNIEYHSSMSSLNIINVPKSLRVSTPSLGLVRERTTEVDSSNGNIVKVNANNNGSWAVTQMEYDQFGNLIHIRYPENIAGEAMNYDYTYDSVYNKYIIKIKDAFGYVSSSTYNSNFDKQTEVIDLTSNKMIFAYDSFGRTTRIVAPKEIQAGLKYTIKFEYYPFLSLLPSGSGVTTSNFVPVAVTSHFDQQHPTNDIQTYTFIDGMARPIQIKKDIYYNNGTATSPNFIEGLSISGKTKFDELGRVIEKYHPYWENLTVNTKFLLNENNSSHKSQVIYDELDRPLKNTDPDGKISFFEYSIDTDDDGVLGIKTKVDVDQNGSQHIITETFKDMSGKVFSTNNIGGASGNIWTRYKYNEIGELLEYIDDEGIATQYKYDMFGRKIELIHPDSGKTNYKYDNVNLVALQTANLENQSIFINYEYEINRLIKIKYPDLPSGASNFANVTYKYGDTGNETGKLIYQEDATGYQEMYYGNMGELSSSIRIVVGPNIPTRQFKTSFSYDSWNRLQSMQYPDGEKIAYSYDLGGNMTRITGELNGNAYDYIKRIDYDYFEQRSYLLYGNGTETFYNYSLSSRRLNNLNVKTSDGLSLFDNKYEYDNVGNVTSLINSAGVTANYMAGKYSHKFDYDNLNRLINAEGSFDGSNNQLALGNDVSSNYTLSMEYNSTHGIANKKQEHIRNATTFIPNTYDNTYKYISNTHKVEAILNNSTGDVESFKYDLNGNITVRNDNNSNREFFWDESNRLRVVSDNHSMQHYIYDGGGERILKANSNMEALYQNGELINPPGTVSINGYTSYPSAFIVITADGVYSKHYYAGMERIVSRIGEDDASIFEIGCMGCKQEISKKSFDDSKLKQAQIQDLNLFAEKARKGKVLLKDYKPISFEEQEKALVADEESDLVEKAPMITPIYYYHPDHLGTSTALTDFNGNAYQFFLNLPFGETMAQQLGSNYYNTPFKFNGKELDEETGFYYFSSRYYDPKISIWLSVDPLAETYNKRNPYEYCFSNPINLIDPTGMGPEDPPTNSQQVNSEISKAKAEHPNAPIYLLVQSDTGEGRDREMAHNGSNLSYDLYTIQDQSNNPNTDYSNGSIIISVRHGDNLITGGVIETNHIDEIYASFSLDFVGAENVGGADELTKSSKNNLPDIVNILNNNNQSVVVSSHTSIKTDQPIDAQSAQAKGLMNGKVGVYNVSEFGNKRIDTVVNSLINAGANSSNVSSGTPNFYRSGDSNARSGTFIDFRFSIPVLKNANKINHSGTINLNKGKLQIF